MLYKGDATVGKTSICQMLGSDGSVFPKNYNFQFDKTPTRWCHLCIL